MIKLSAEQQRVFNDTFIEQIGSGNTKEASVSLQAFTRDKLREDSFTEKVLTPIDINNDELDKTSDPEVQVKWCDREPTNVPAVTIPLGTAPDSFQFTGTRYAVYPARIVSPMYEKDVDLLRGFGYDIRAVLLEQNTKDIGTEIDTRFLTKVNSVIGSVNTANSLNGLGLPQNVTIAGGITRQNLKEANKVITRLKVPFGPMQKDGADSKGCMLVNNTTLQDLLGFERSEAGGDESQRAFIEGTPAPTIFGVKAISTIKDDLVPDGVIYYFSSEEFFARYIRLQPLTAFMKNEAYFLQFMQYCNVGLSIGNVKGVTRVQFV